MKIQNCYITKSAVYLRFTSLLACFFILLFWSSCQQRKEPYTIIEFQNGDEVCNYSKSLLISVSKQTESGNCAVIGSKGDLFLLGDFMYQLPDTSTQQNFMVNYTDSILFVNGKVTCIHLSGKDTVVPWLKNVLEKDLSVFQMINISSDTIGGFLQDLKELAAIRPDAGIIFSGDFNKMDDFLKVFQPSIIISPIIYESDYGKLAGMSKLKMLFVNAGDTLMTIPLPAIPSLKQLALTDIGTNAVITRDLLINNQQIEKVGFSNGGNLDMSVLRPLKNLKELVISGADSLLNPEEISLHKNLEVLVLAGDDLNFDPSVIHLPRLRWLSVPSSVIQDEFNTLLKNHPDLEVVEILKNDTIKSLSSLSGLSKLSGLTVMDTVTDLQAIKTMKGLKYLSLPYKLLEDSILRVELHQALPNTTIAANEGFCLGSGWLLLILPMVLIIVLIRFRRDNKQVQS